MLVAMSIQGYQEEVNPQVGHKNPEAKEGAQMMQSSQAQLAQIVRGSLIVGRQ